MQGRPGAAAQCGWRAVQGRRSYVRGLPAAVDGPRTPAAISSQWGGRGSGRGRAAAASDYGVPGANPGAGGGEYERQRFAQVLRNQACLAQLQLTGGIGASLGGPAL